MSIQASKQSPSLTAHARSKKHYVCSFAVAATTLLSGLGLSATSMTTHAAGLGDLFGNQSTSKPKFLPVEQAFQVSSSSTAVQSGTRLTINFDITPEHYVYKEKLKLSLPAGVTAAPFTFNQTPYSIDDPTFGTVPVFDQANVTATTVLTNRSGQGLENAPIIIGWQGCAKAGLCYPPEKIKTSVDIKAAASQTTNDRNAAALGSNADVTDELTDKASSVANSKTASIATDAMNAQSTASTGQQSTIEDGVIDYDMVDDSSVEYDSLDGSASMNTLSGADTTVGEDTVAESTVDDSPATTDSFVDSDPFGLMTHPWLALVLLFLAGLGLALTPCVLPMLPIVANIVAREQNPTVKRGVILTTSYAIGVATAYGVLGAIIAVFGESLGIIGWLQNPVILIGFAIVFVLLALYMLDAFTVRLPQALSRKMQGLSQAGDSKLGSTGGSLIAGFLSALVVSPCVSAPLFGALLAVSTIGSPALGFVALFMLGFGLSAPLILIGATQGKVMPKAGEWMNWVKQGFALLLFAVALLLIERVFISPVMLIIWALWFMVVAMWAWSWLGKARMLTQAISLMAGIWAACLIVGAALGNDDSLHPLASLSSAPMLAQSTTSQLAGAQSANDTTITTLAELDAIVAANPNVLVDLTAEWCIECRIMDKNLFHNRPAQMQDWQLVRLDITETTEDSKAILSRYKLFGPPALLYYQDGKLSNQQVGEIGRAEFEQTLSSLNE